MTKKVCLLDIVEFLDIKVGGTLHSIEVTNVSGYDIELKLILREPVRLGEEDD